MDKNGVFLQLYARADAPSRDYFGITITEKQVILNVWNISHGPHVFPKSIKCPIDEFSEDKFLILEVERMFGRHVVDFCLNLSNQVPNLQCMPTKIFLYILRHLATNDILRLSQTSKIFFELCNRDAAWKLIFGKRNSTKPCRDDTNRANELGWKNALKTKVLLEESDKPKTILKQNCAINSKNLLNKTQSTSILKPAIKKPTSTPTTISKPCIKPHDNLNINTPTEKFASCLLSSTKIEEKRPVSAIKIKTTKDPPKPTKSILKNSPKNPNIENPFRVSSELFQVPSHSSKSANVFNTSKLKSSSTTRLNNSKIKNVQDKEKTPNNKINLPRSNSSTVNLINNLRNSSMKIEKNVNVCGDNVKKNLNQKAQSAVKSGIKKIVTFKN